MVYGQRDKLLQAIVAFTTSEKASEMSIGDRQILLAKIRDKYAPDISNDEWKELATGVNNFKFVIIDSVKNNEVSIIENQLPNDNDDNNDEESLDKDEPESEGDEDDKKDDIETEDGETKEDDFDEPKKEEKKSEPEPEQFGRTVKPKEQKPLKSINTTRLRGLLKPKKKDG